MPKSSLERAFLWYIKEKILIKSLVQFCGCIGLHDWCLLKRILLSPHGNHLKTKNRYFCEIAHVMCAMQQWLFSIFIGDYNKDKGIFDFQWTSVNLTNENSEKVTMRADWQVKVTVLSQ